LDVVIPMRNGAKTICATLESVLAQTISPQRIIVVDDGSDDAGAALIAGYPLVEIIRTGPVGASHARNVGAWSSHADYVAFLDCDDLWRLDKLKRQLEIAMRTPDIAVVTCDQVHVHMAGGIIPWTHDAPRFGENAFDDLLSRCFMHGGWSSNILVRRSAFLDCGGFDERLQFGEDADLCLRLARSHSFGHIAECLAYIRENPDSMMRQKRSPEWYLEVALQQLSIAEKWAPAGVVRGPVVAQCVWLILMKFARGPLRYDRLTAFRRDLMSRVPNLAAKIARSDAHFLLVLGVMGILQFPHALTAGMRHLARRGSRAKSLAVNADYRSSPPESRVLTD